MAYTYKRHSNPNRTEVSDAEGWLATFTDNSRTVTLRGNERTFTEQSAGITDQFARTVEAGWRNSPDGGNWYTVGGTEESYSVDGTSGLMHATATGTAYRTVITHPLQNIDARVKLSSKGNPSGYGLQQGLMFHYQDSRNHLEVQLSSVPGKVTDNFGRTSSSGWGKSSSGHVWNSVGGEASEYVVEQSTGRHILNTVNSSLRSILPATRDFDCKVKIATSALSEGAATLAGVMGRYQNTNNYYYFRVRYASAPARRPVFIGIQKYVDGKASFVGNEIATNLDHQPNTYLWVRASAEGDTLRMKLWPDGENEPTAWHINATDTSIDTAGQVGSRSLVGAGNSNKLPLTIFYDSFSLTPLNAPVGDTQLILQKRVDNDITVMNAAPLGLTYENTQAFQLRVVTRGANIQARAWPGDAEEPTDWTLTASDTTFTSGSLGLRGFCSTATPVMPVTFSFNNYRVQGEWPEPPTITHRTWVRLLASPFAGEVDEKWLTQQLGNTRADILDYSLQYLALTSPIRDTNGQQIAGDAGYSELLPTGERQEGADFNDYLGLDWSYSKTSVRQAEPVQLHCLDCSGFVRMVFGYRGGIPLGLSASTAKLPRTSTNLAYNAPGTLIAASENTRPSTDQLTPGDVVYFGVAERENAAESYVAHIGIYLGIDTAGNQRFISSRRTLNGPTFADIGGVSTLNGTGQYPETFRAIRRF